MSHPGLAFAWAYAIAAAMFLLALWALWIPATSPVHRIIPLSKVPGIGSGFSRRLQQPFVLKSLRLLMVCAFLLLIAAGLFGSPIAERNVATVITWNVWWPGVILSVFFFGGAWCAVCPWDTLARWMARFTVPGTATARGLQLIVPRALRNLWPASILLIALSWLELGFGITASPYGTAVLSLSMIVLVFAALVLFQRRAFCRYFCPVGRTIGVYSQLAPVELRPVKQSVCDSCTSLECYHGTDTIEACPTRLVMGRLKENTYCTSCGNCVSSCPDDNVAWRLRSPHSEISNEARAHWDEAWFMLLLLGLTGFHGISMMPYWEPWLRDITIVLGGSSLLSFSLSMALYLAAIVALYAVCVALTPHRTGFRRGFSELAFVSVPLAFSYHLAHNLNHLLREARNLPTVLVEPFGFNALPPGAQEQQLLMLPLLPPPLMYSLQTLLMVYGFWVAMQIIRQRSGGVGVQQRFGLIAFALLITGFHVWLLVQPMVMRLGCFDL